MGIVLTENRAPRCYASPASFIIHPRISRRCSGGYPSLVSVCVGLISIRASCKSPVTDIVTIGKQESCDIPKCAPRKCRLSPQPSFRGTYCAKGNLGLLWLPSLLFSSALSLLPRFQLSEIHNTKSSPRPPYVGQGWNHSSRRLRLCMSMTIANWIEFSPLGDPTGKATASCLKSQLPTCSYHRSLKVMIHATQ